MMDVNRTANRTPTPTQMIHTHTLSQTLTWLLLSSLQHPPFDHRDYSNWVCKIFTQGASIRTKEEDIAHTHMPPLLIACFGDTEKHSFLTYQANKSICADVHQPCSLLKPLRTKQMVCVRVFGWVVQLKLTDRQEDRRPVKSVQSFQTKHARLASQ